MALYFKKNYSNYKIMLYPKKNNNKSVIVFKSVHRFSFVIVLYF